MINDGTSATGWTNHSNATVSAASITGWRGNTITALKALAAGSNLTVAINFAFTAFGTAASLSNPTRGALVFDMHVGAQTWALLANGSTGATAAFYLLDAGEANFFLWEVQVTQGWNRIVLHPANAAVTGTPTWGTTAFTVLRMRINALVGYTGTFHISNLAFAGTTHKKSALCLHFDDAKSGVYDTAFPLMKARGLVGSVGVIGDQIGQATYMTAAQLRELVANGWSMYNHSDTHAVAPFLIAAAEATVTTEYADCVTAGTANGLTFYGKTAGPYGEWDTGILASMNTRGVKAYRGLISATGFITNPQADYIPNISVMPCCQIINGVSAATALTWIDGAIVTKSMLILLLHDIQTVGSASPPVLATSVFTTLVDGLATRQNTNRTLDVMNWDAWCELGGLAYARQGHP